VKGLQTLVARLTVLGDAQRTALRGEALLRADPKNRWLLMDLARVTLIGAGDWELAKEWSEALKAQVPGILLASQGSSEAQLMVGRVHLLAAIVALANGDQQECRAQLALGHKSIHGVIIVRGDRRPARAPQVIYAEAMQVRALLLLADLYGELLLHSSSSDAELLSQARDLHQASLEVDAARARFMAGTPNTWDALLRADMSMLLLLLNGERMPGLKPGAGLKARESLGRLLTTVSGAEMPGFEPYDCASERIVNPLKDPGRAYWLDAQRWGWMYASERAADAERAAVEPLRVPFVLDDETLAAEQRRSAQLRFARSLVQNPLDQDVYRRLRWPSDMALRIAADLRADGRPVDALRLAQRFGRDMAQAEETPSWFLLAQFQRARADMQEGTAYTDMDEPLRAQDSLLRGVERVESLIETIQARDLGQAAMAQAKEQLAGLLVSLAVNANVKLGQPERAVAWVEKANALRGDSSSIILLACYRARAGRFDEARDLISQARPVPGVEYNLACTHALLGNREAALDWLERALERRGTSARGLAREKDWAARDPDLVSLREDARFQALIE
jgi:tetratricopeptide (TPR) repeat protein